MRWSIGVCNGRNGAIDAVHVIKVVLCIHNTSARQNVGFQVCVDEREHVILEFKSAIVLVLQYMIFSQQVEDSSVAERKVEQMVNCCI